MKTILDSKQMKACDSNTIQIHGIPSLTLMERAALSVYEEIKNRFDTATKVGLLCGTGNNGGDGLAIARLLHLAGFDTKVMLIGDSDKQTESTSAELAIAKSYGVVFCTTFSDLDDSELLIDALFGIGLSRPVEGIFLEAIEYINSHNAYVVAVDIPSGYSANTGNILGAGVCADLTVTFAYLKKGLLLSDCALNHGQLVITDIGIYLDAEPLGIVSRAFSSEDLILIPSRPQNANKGTCGKILIIAGSESIYGACYLSAKAAMTVGSGLVKIYTHKNNITAIQTALPEAMYEGYDEFDKEHLLQLLDWPDAILVGPGVGTSELSKNILATVLENAIVPTIIDADGLNLLAENINLLDNAKAPVVLTPHLKEMERLCGQKVSSINNSMEQTAMNFVAAHKCTLVLKNYVTLIATSPNENYINLSGCEALATAGSGDVLAGVICALLGLKLAPEIAAPLGAFIHGAAGEIASTHKGINGVLASDIVDGIIEVM